MPRDAEELVELLDLETIDDNLFRGPRQASSLPRVFGGQVAAQALVAGARTADPAYAVHSLHSYFLQPGDPATPIVYDVENLRDGRSFATRRVLARQHGRPIYAQTLELQRPEEGFDHQDPMPQLPGPDESIDPWETRRRSSGDEVHENRDISEDDWGAVELRYVGSSADGLLPPDERHPGRQACWLRVSGRLPDEPLVHLAAFTFLSDMTIMGAALAPHGARMGDPSIQAASLDHTIWFHRPFRPDEWWLYDQVSPSASGGRGLIHGRVFTGDGRLVASVAQEALLRPRG